MSLARALFAPRAVALVGASGDEKKNTARPQRYLAKHGYAGKVFPVNPTRKTVLKERAYPSLAEIPEAVDHAFIMVEDVEAALEGCGRRGVQVASIYSDGFADRGAEGAERQRRLVARARELGVRVLGPNSMGMINLSGRAPITVNAVLEMDAPPVGGTSLVSQSGTMLGTLLSRGAGRGLGFSKLVSVGNEADLGVGEIVDLLADDAETKVILLFLETVRDARALSAAARKAFAAGKPVVAYKLGRSAAGEALARSHTGALAGSDGALDAYFRDCGILRVDMLETLVEFPPLLEGRRPRPPKSKPHVAVVTTTGGGAATVVDRLGLLGIETASPDGRPIVDLTMAASPGKYQETLEGLLAWPGCDAVLAAVGSSAQFHPELAVQPIVKAKGAAKPLAAFLTPHAERSLALLAASGIAAFRTPEACADAFAAYFAWRAPRQPECFSTPHVSLEDAFALVRSLGIPVVEQAIARAPDYAHAIGYPVAAKILGEHKTDVGGVVLNIRNEVELKTAVRKLGAQEVLIQRMEAGLAEAIVGYRNDPVVGPIVIAGVGGTLAELYRDVQIRMAPVSKGEALEMIEAVRGLAVVRGYRNLPPGDVAALARAVSAFSTLCFFDEISEAEINPLIVKAEGAVAVDALLALKIDAAGRA
ncbi:MAG TPA: acetate--CoA ligase family protein [Burkholderiales bacterium]|nr:acetate--CoA ligase family protein [Burkholderiales bacterium]